MPGGEPGVGVGFVNFGWGVVGAILVASGSANAFESDRDWREGIRTRMNQRDKLLIQIPMKIRYSLIIYWSEVDQAFIVEVPELAGCMADGETYQEAVQNIEILIHEWIEVAKEMGRLIPEPRGRLLFA